MYRFIQIILLAVVCSFSQAQPQKIINVVFGGTPGGKDVVFRHITSHIEKTNLNVRFNYDFRPGAGEIIAYNYVSNLSSQTNTIFVTTVNLFVYLDIWNLKDISVLPMDVVFGPVISTTPNSIIAPANSAISTPGDFVNQIKIAKSNIGGTFTTKLYHEYILEKLGADRSFLQFVPYKSGGDGGLAVASQQIEFANVPAFASYSLYKAGKIKIIAIAGDQRLERLPEVPLLRDAIPGAVFTQATILVLPPGTTTEKVNFYRDLFAPAVNDPDVKKNLDELLTTVTPQLNDPVAARAYVQRLRDKWQPYAKRIQPE